MEATVLPNVSDHGCLSRKSMYHHNLSELTFSIFIKKAPTPYTCTSDPRLFLFIISKSFSLSFLTFVTHNVFYHPIDVILHSTLPSERRRSFGESCPKSSSTRGRYGKRCASCVDPLPRLFWLTNSHTDKVLSIGPGTWNCKLHAAPSIKVCC